MNNGKHLTEENRYDIELYINEGFSFTKISKIINKDRTTIAKEIKRNRIKKIPKSSHRNIPKNFCMHKHLCGKLNCTSDKSCYIEEICPKLTKAPYVCNACNKKRTCRMIKYYYYSNFAHKSYMHLLSNSRTGINLTENQIALIDKEISPLLLKQDQPINHIYTYKKDILPFSKPTFYSYINKNVFTFRNIDLPRKVKLKPRNTNILPIVKKDKNCRNNRTYEDYQKYITLHPNASIVQMDTVEGIKGGKVFLTLLFVKTNLMLIFLLDNKDTDCVFNAFEFIKHSIGIDNFTKYFEVILTDNGSEFSDPISIEVDMETGEIISNLFYCDPGKSWQKGNIEKNHEYIRYVLPKGTSFDNLTQEDTNLLMNHINNTCRDSLNGKSPYDVSTHMDFLNNLNIHKIDPSKVNLSKNLLKK
jgi:IS30 family transposase